MLLGPDSRITVLEGARHNLPDRDAMEAATAIRELASGLTEQDLLLVLISGEQNTPAAPGLIPGHCS